jgi:nucleoside-diphosphate-sugar epimerase
MKVLIVGCGYVGSALGAELVRAGHDVFGLRRTRERDAELVGAGIHPLAADIRSPEALAVLDSAYDWVVQCVSASGGQARDYQEVYVEGTRNLITWLSAAPPSRFVYTSSTGVYGQLDGSLVDESSSTNPSTETGRILLKAEEYLLDEARRTGFPVIILRVAGIYGPGRAYWLEQLLAGTASVDGAGERVLNMVHQQDVAGAIQVALERGRTGRVYNVVDDEPVTQRTFLDWLAGHLGRPSPPTAEGPGSDRGKRGQTSKRVSNRRLRQELAYKLRFPTFREGYAALTHGRRRSD